MKMSAQRRKLIEDARAAGFQVVFVSTSYETTVAIYKVHPRTKIYTRGVRIYPNGTAVDLTVDPAYQRAIKTYAGMRKILGLADS